MMSAGYLVNAGSIVHANHPDWYADVLRVSCGRLTMRSS